MHSISQARRIASAEAVCNIRNEGERASAPGVGAVQAAVGTSSGVLSTNHRMQAKHLRHCTGNAASPWRLSGEANQPERLTFSKLHSPAMDATRGLRDCEKHFLNFSSAKRKNWRIKDQGGGLVLLQGVSKSGVKATLRSARISPF